MTQRSRDFEKVHSEFVNYYGASKGDAEYRSWLHDLGLNETLTYGQTTESFQWARDMIQQVKEDADAKYYKVLLGFPRTSMNGNVYKERDLIAAALKIKGKSPDMNHKSQFWLNTENKYNRWGPSVTTEGAKYEGGAVEVIMRVPKATLCPVCGYGEPLTKLIDEKKIVNVSLNGETIGPNHEVFQFNEQIPYTLLTSNVLPGFPMARIFPIEAYLPFKSSTYKNRTIKIIGLEKMTEKEPTCECPEGQHCENGKCVPDDKKETITGLPNRTGTSKVISSIPSFTSVGGSQFLKNANDNATPRTNAVTSHQGDFPLSGKMISNQEEVNPISGAGTAYVPASQDLANKHAVKPPLAGTTSVGGLIDMPDNTGTPTIQGESIPELKVKTLKAEQRAKSYEIDLLETQGKLQDAYGQVNSLTGELRANRTSSHDTIERLELQVNNLNIEKAKDIAEKRDLTRRLEDMTTSRDGYKTDYEAIKTQKENLEGKYREQLKTNLALEQKLTQTNEEYLEQAKKTETLEDKVKHVNRITRIKTTF